jgi:hypothetical protein
MSKYKIDPYPGRLVIKIVGEKKFNKLWRKHNLEGNPNYYSAAVFELKDKKYGHTTQYVIMFIEKFMTFKVVPMNQSTQLIVFFTIMQFA